MPLITVFTPTYNRATTLVRTYESLCSQTEMDFEWLIIDDGSTDNTRDLVNNWISDAKIIIKYIYKENGGLHTGYNEAFANINTELNVCIDSDDFMPNDAIEKIKAVWKQCNHKTKLAGIIGLDFKLDDTPIGGLFPFTGDYHIYEMCQFHRGDTKIICRTDIIKPYSPMPVFKGEKNFNPIYYYVQIDKDYKFRLVNENLCYVDYQESGMSANIFHQYMNSPKSFAQLRRLYLSMPYYDFWTHFRNSIHYVSSCIFSNQWLGIRTSPRPFMCLFAIPFGIALNIYIRYKCKFGRKHVN